VIDDRHNITFGRIIVVSCYSNVKGGDGGRRGVGKNGAARM